MALEKEITLENGIKANYHRIQTARMNFIEDECSIVLVHYVSKEIRDREKELVTMKTKIDSLHVEQHKAIENNDENLAAALEEKISTLSNEYYTKLSETYHVGTTVLSLDKVPEDFSMSSFYKIIPQSFKEFNKAKKV